MGVPFFQIKELVRKNKVHVYSSNYTLYGDISSRVMSVLKDLSDGLRDLFYRRSIFDFQ